MNGMIATFLGVIAALVVVILWMARGWTLRDFWNDIKTW